MENMDIKSLELIIEPLIEMNESPMVYLIIDKLYKFPEGIQYDVLEEITIPEKDRTPTSFYQFKETLKKLKEMELIDYERKPSLNILLTLRGSETYRADRAAKVTVLSSVRSEFEKEGNLTDSEIEKEINESYLLTLRGIQQEIIEAAVN